MDITQLCNQTVMEDRLSSLLCDVIGRLEALDAKITNLEALIFADIPNSTLNPVRLYERHLGSI